MSPFDNTMEDFAYVCFVLNLHVCSYFNYKYFLRLVVQFIFC